MSVAARSARGIAASPCTSPGGLAADDRRGERGHVGPRTERVAAAWLLAGVLTGGARDHARRRLGHGAERGPLLMQRPTRERRRRIAHDAQGALKSPEPVAEDERAKIERAVIRTGGFLAVRRLPVFLVLVVIGIGYWIWDATHHDHDTEHGPPLTIAEVEQYAVGPYQTSEGEVSETVTSATCLPGEDGNGEEPNQHFRCDLVFEGGGIDNVVVHVEPDALLFKTS
jgi:hypothetical protein